MKIPSQLETALRNMEGVEHEAYQDNRGNWTIGVGHKGSYPGEIWTNAQIDAALDKDINTAANGLNRALPWLETLGEVRWGAMVNQCFNMGLGNLLNFHEQLTALQASDWVGAAHAMQDSEWFQQDPSRVNALAYQIITDEWVLDYLDADQLDKLATALHGGAG